MPKAGNKTSSASSATKKKQARKAGKDEPVEHPPQRGQKVKGLSKAEKKALKNGPKLYVPPPKPPQPALPDPLDAQGLARTLPAELVVVLRRLGKKDPVTKRKGLEELRDGWITVALTGGSTPSDGADLEKELKELALIEALPVWLHHLPSLLLSPAHRLLSLQTQTSLLQLPQVRDSLINTLNLGLLPGERQCRDIVGAWLFAAVEEGRRTTGPGRDALAAFQNVSDWEATVQDENNRKLVMVDHLANLTEFLNLAILDPAELHAQIHPPTPTISASQTGSGRNTPSRTNSSNIKGGSKMAHPFISEMSSATYEAQAADVKAQAEAAVDEEELLNRYRLSGILSLTYVLQSMLGGKVDGPLETLLRNEALWDLISIAPPPVRRAMYPLLQTLTQQHLEFVKLHLVPIVGARILSTVWKEEDGSVWRGGVVSEALVLFLTKFREAWLLEGDDTAPEDDGDGDAEAEDDSSSEDNEDSGNDEKMPLAAPLPFRIGHAALENLLIYLQRGCNGFPAEGYPILLVVLSTIPEQILSLSVPSLSKLFNSLWAAIDARLLASQSIGNTAAPILDGLNAIVDSLVYLVVKTTRVAGTVDEDVHEIQSWAVQEYRRIWADGIIPELSKLVRMDRSMMGEKRTPAGRAATAAAQALGRLAETIPDMAGRAFDHTCELLEEVFYPGSDIIAGLKPDNRPILLGRFHIPIEALRDALGDKLGATSKTDALIHRVFSKVLDWLEAVQFSSDMPAESIKETEHFLNFFASLLNRFPQAVEADHQAQIRFTAFLTDRAAVLTSLTENNIVGPLYLSFFNLPSSSSAGQQMWQTISQAVALRPKSQPKRYEIALAFTSTWRPSPQLNLNSDGTAWATICDDALALALEPSKPGSSSAKVFVMQCLSGGNDILTGDDIDQVLILTATAIHGQMEDALFGNELIDAQKLLNCLEIYERGFVDRAEALLSSEVHRPTLLDCGLLANAADLVLQGNSLATQVKEVAGRVWQKVAIFGSSESQNQVMQEATQRLIELVTSKGCSLHPSTIIETLSRGGLSTLTLADLLPHLNDGLASHLAQPVPPQLSLVVDDLLPYDAADGGSSKLTLHDEIGRSSYARCIEAAISLAYGDLPSLQANTRILYHIIACSRLAGDELACKGGSRKVFGGDAQPEYLEQIIEVSERLLSYCTARSDAGSAVWHQNAIAGLQKRQLTGGIIEELLLEYTDPADSNSSDVNVRNLRDLIDRILRSVSDNAVAERWFMFGYSTFDRPGQESISRAICSSASRHLSKSPRLDRARNELASNLTSVKVAQANTQGLKLLRLLSSIAPGKDSGDDFIPAQRTVFLMQHLNSWFLSEDEAADDICEEVEARMAVLYSELVPVIQSVTGSHWDSIFDMIANNLESSTLDDPSTYNILYSTLLLLSQIHSLSQSNKVLREIWTDKQAHCTELIRLLTTLRSDTPVCLASQRLLGMIVCILDETPMTIPEEHVGELYRLLNSTPLFVQRTLVQLLTQSVHQVTEKLVIDLESTIDQDDETKLPELPEALIASVTSESPDGEVGSLLAWLLVFAHFDQASTALRNAYIEQLRRQDAISNILLPSIMQRLRGTLVKGKTNEPAPFSVDEFHIDLMEEADDFCLTSLSAHVFYRSLQMTPTLVREWYESIKDKQAANTFGTIISRHFSPAIIESELSVLKVVGATSELEDENMTIKVISGAPEINAKYIIDEQPLEISIKLPSDFPLKNVEVKELKRVGVTEAKWRGWLLNVQQMIMSRVRIQNCKKYACCIIFHQSLIPLVCSPRRMVSSSTPSLSSRTTSLFTLKARLNARSVTRSFR